MKLKESLSDRIFLAFIYVCLIALCATVIVPVFQVLTVSFSKAEDINKFGLHLFPTDPVLDGYKRVFADTAIWRAYGVTIVRTLMGTAITVVFTFLGAYPLSKKDMPFNKALTVFILITMFFSGGMIPMYLLLKSLGLMNSIWSLVLPGAMNTFLLLVTRNFIIALPEVLEESAKIEGANSIQILYKIVMPLSMPILATVALYTAVHHWNAWFDCMLYITKADNHVLQLVLRRILLDGRDAALESTTILSNVYVDPESVKMATLVVAMVPIIAVYPFLQKFFIKGVLVGSVKG